MTITKRSGKETTNWGAVDVALLGSGVVSSIRARVSVDTKWRGKDTVLVIGSRRRGALGESGTYGLSDWSLYSVEASLDGEFATGTALTHLSEAHSHLLDEWLASDEAESTLRRTLALTIRGWAAAKIGTAWNDDMRYDDVVVSSPISEFGSFADLLDELSVGEFAQELTELETLTITEPITYSEDGRLFSLDLVAA